jgi:choline-sulfatase
MMDRCLNAYHGTRRYNLRDADALYKLRRAYYGLVTYMDRKVGEVLDTLQETGLADNTVVVFASDHGDMLCEKEMVQKRCFYEWSCRVPLIARFPDGWQAGTACDTPVSLIDLWPNFLRNSRDRGLIAARRR